jgi:DNA-directed RNA polymerase specialized sigma24 family protein
MNEQTHHTPDDPDMELTMAGRGAGRAEPDTVASRKDAFSRVMEHALQRPRKDRALLALYLMYGEDWVRIGKELGIDDDAVRTRWNHIRQRVGEAVERHEQG